MKQSRKTDWRGEMLSGKRIAITGATGGLGREVCRELCRLAGEVIMIVRDRERGNRQRQLLLTEFPQARIMILTAELSDPYSVEQLCRQLEELGIDILILNAGVYQVPRFPCKTGVNNIFQINFLTPYYMTRRLLPGLMQRDGRIVAVGSIAHTYSKTDPGDVDFSGRPGSPLCYGNSKRYLMFALWGLQRENPGMRLSVVHPGISVTGITNHFPPLVYSVIKWPMKLIFMKPRKAARSILAGIFTDCDPCCWIGPRYFRIWGKPGKEILRTCSREEQTAIFEQAEALCRRMRELVCRSK